jgi:ABC-type dipeptide/oligopeptide/nickel transport system permease component
MSNSHLIGVFDDESGLVKAVEEIRGKDLKIEEVFTPYPIHEVIHAMGNKSKLQIFAYFYGLFGALAVLAFLYWTSVIDWPINYGGKPFNSFPSFIIITIILTIFIVTVSSLATFSGRAKLWPGKQHKSYDPRATDDKFVIVISKDETAPGALGTIQGIFKANGAVEIREEEA